MDSIVSTAHAVILAPFLSVTAVAREVRPSSHVKITFTPLSWGSNGGVIGGLGGGLVPHRKTPTISS
ncbi:LOW QUALITY PROTEIN: hypothetical protein TorRG33x02_294510 [Trema orientale]|uniref:Transmembrane protein n=1 Tax=Trema orientale TaxID=63057 RepID=A0A2P5C7X7_TREOI|nr:LOW QUALITY PROTEIN: hypothetical protein TorRG33x02_294510 [Trema orientale]